MCTFPDLTMEFHPGIGVVARKWLRLNVRGDIVAVEYQLPLNPRCIYAPLWSKICRFWLRNSAKSSMSQISCEQEKSTSGHAYHENIIVNSKRLFELLNSWSFCVSESTSILMESHKQFRTNCEQERGRVRSRVGVRRQEIGHSRPILPRVQYERRGQLSEGVRLFADSGWPAS